MPNQVSTLDQSLSVITDSDASIPPANADYNSRRERKAIDDYARQDAHRGNRERNANHWIKMVVLWILAISVLIIFLIRIAHFILPLKDQWVTPENLQAIDKYFFSGAVGGALAKYGGTIFNDKSRNKTD